MVNTENYMSVYKAALFFNEHSSMLAQKTHLTWQYTVYQVILNTMIFLLIGISQINNSKQTRVYSHMFCRLHERQMQLA